MIKNNKIHVIAFLLLANIVTVTSITVQAASIQEAVDVEAVQMIRKEQTMGIEPSMQIGQSFCTAQTIAAQIVPEIKETVVEIEKQKAIEAEKIAQEQALAKYNQELLASIIFCEAGNQSYEGQVAVGAVVMNRIQSEKFPDTMEEVIYQSGQFVPAMTGWLDEVRATSGYTESALQAAKDAILGANPIGDCLFFDQGGYGYQIGAHYFH